MRQLPDSAHLLMQALERRDIPVQILQSKPLLWSFEYQGWQYMQNETSQFSSSAGVAITRNSSALTQVLAQLGIPQAENCSDSQWRVHSLVIDGEVIVAVARQEDTDWTEISLPKQLGKQLQKLTSELELFACQVFFVTDSLEDAAAYAVCEITDRLALDEYEVFGVTPTPADQFAEALLHRVETDAVHDLPVIGHNTMIDFSASVRGVPAKIDTGADSSAVWASDIHMNEDGSLQFVLFGEGSPHYTGEVIRTSDYSVAAVRSASGHKVIKFYVRLLVGVLGKRVWVRFGLSDRSSHTYPILIGRRTLKHKFLVDVREKDESLLDVSTATPRSNELNVELQADPVAFYKKYHGKEID